MWQEEYEVSRGVTEEGWEGRRRGFAEAALRRNKAGDMHTNCASKQTSTRRRPRPPHGETKRGSSNSSARGRERGAGNNDEEAKLKFGQLPKAGGGRTGNIFINNNLFCAINNVGIVCFRCTDKRARSQSQQGRWRRESDTETKTETSPQRQSELMLMLMLKPKPAPELALEAPLQLLDMEREFMLCELCAEDFVSGITSIPGSWLPVAVRVLLVACCVQRVVFAVCATA